MDFSKLRNLLVAGSFCLGLASTVTVFVGDSKIKPTAYAGIGAGMAGIGLLQIIDGAIAKESEKLLDNANKAAEDKEKDIQDKEKEISGLQLKIKSHVGDIERMQQGLISLENKVKSSEVALRVKTDELIEAQKDATEAKLNLQNVGRFNASESHRIVRETYNRQVKKVECLVNALIRNYKQYKDELEDILNEFDDFRWKFLKEVESYEAINSFEDLLDIGLELQERIIDRSVELRCKAQAIIIKNFGAILEDSVGVDQVEEIVESLTGQAKDQIESVKAEWEADRQSIVSEWVVSNEGIVERYNTEYTNTLNLAKDAANRMERLEAELHQKEVELAELRKPIQAFGDSTYARAANAVSNWYYNKGYVLDYLEWTETEIGYTILYSIRRNPGLTEKELYEDNSREQLAAFTNSLHGTLPKFDFNRQNSTVTLTVQLRRLVKTSIEKLEVDINKIWVPAEKFESYVRKFERVRLTSGSTGGKSPTAKNLALAIMNARGGKGEIKLYDPQHGSKKDYWGMPKAGTSHEDNFTGLKEVCDLIDARRNSRDNQFKLYIFDEVDNTIANLGKQAGDYRNLLKISIKEGSHADVGVIYIGQSADANEIPGMTHSNWNNCVAMHIGSNAGTAIDTLRTLTSEDKTRLLEQYRKIQNYCDRKNEELGLDIITDPTALRFALVVPLSGLPKFIQLPDFDSYEYNEVMGQSSHSTTEDISDTDDDICPNCGGTDLARNGRYRGQQRYICKSCGEKFKV